MRWPPLSTWRRSDAFAQPFSVPTDTLSMLACMRSTMGHSVEPIPRRERFIPRTVGGMAWSSLDDGLRVPDTIVSIRILPILDIVMPTPSRTITAINDAKTGALDIISLTSFVSRSGSIKGPESSLLLCRLRQALQK